MPKSNLYNRETAQRVIDKYPEFPQFNQEKCLDILRMVYRGIVKGQHIKQKTYWQIQATARNVHKRLRQTLEQPEKPDLEERVEEPKTPIKIRELEYGQRSLFDGKPHTW